MKSNFKSEDYYEILGVDKQADEEEIRKKYKNLAKQYHPDRNPNKKEECTIIFKQITEAYEVLSDKEKRTHYDKYGKEGIKMEHGGFNPFDIFEQMFGGIRMNTKRRNIPPLKHTIVMDLKEIYNGKKVKISIERKQIFTPENQPLDPHKYEQAAQQCITCQGQGKSVKLVQLAPGFISQQMIPCETCQGAGYTLYDSYKTKNVKETIIIDVKPGTPYQSCFEIPHKGDMIPGYPVADLEVYIVENPNPQYRRYGQDIHIDYTISLAEALIGKEIYFTHFDGRILKLKHDDIITPELIKKVSNEGLPYPDQPRKGNLYLKFKIQFPTKLTKSQQKQLAQIFPLSNPPVSSISLPLL